MGAGKGTLNKVMLVGRLGADPQIKTTTSGKMHASFNMATVNVWKDKAGEKQERTDWHRVTAWGRQAEIAGEYLKKGSYVYVEGRQQTRSYDDADGIKKFITEIVVENFQMLGKREDYPQAEEAPPPGDEELAF